MSTSDLATELQALATRIAEAEADRAAARATLRRLALEVGVPGAASPAAIAEAVLGALRSQTPATWRVEQTESGLALCRRTEERRSSLLLPTTIGSLGIVCEVCGEPIPKGEAAWRGAGPARGEQPLPSRNLRVCRGCVDLLRG